MNADSLANLSERDAGVSGGDLARLAALDDLGLLEPLVRLRQLYRLAVGRLQKMVGLQSVSVINLVRPSM